MWSLDLSSHSDDRLKIMFIWSKLSSPKWEDAWQERFHSEGQTNAVISEVKGGKTIRVEVYCETREHAEDIQKLFGGSLRELKKENWAAMKPPPRGPIKIRKALVVTEEADEKKIEKVRQAHPGRGVIAIPAQMAFGTGDHATTATCLRFLVDISKEYGGEEWSMLDVGCGSGILAIAASKSGASKVDGFDYDDHAVEVADANAERNGVAGHVTFSERDLLGWKPKKSERWDCVFANVFADILAAAAPTLAKVVRPGGHLVVSGILKEHSEECLTALRAEGFDFIEIKTIGKWTTARARR
ncbi:MAG: ribosomal protein L11 methyltransferase [Pseudoalteromonas tetraodonis]|jgi:ribosomal protein L11 methyltransferase